MQIFNRDNIFDFISFGGESGPSLDEQRKLREEYERLIKEEAKESEELPDACPSCGKRHFQVLYATSDAMFGSLVYNGDRWEFHHPRSAEYRVKCLNCGAIYDIMLKGDGK